MENNEILPKTLNTDQNQQIQLVINQPSEEGDSINFGNVFQNMKRQARLYVLVLVLFLSIGVSIPLLIYQLTKKPLTVSSIVTLRYQINGRAVTNLTAPDGTALDLNQITSAYVLQEALSGLNLSKPITIAALRSNIEIKTVMTEESQRAREALARFADAKNTEAYNQLQKTKIDYQNRFIVTLTNGFKNDSEARTSTELKNDELKLLLNRILTEYNRYLVRTYADVQLPEDPFTMIDIENLDVLDSLDQIRNGINHVINFIDNKPQSVQEYRSWKTGQTLTNLREILITLRNDKVNYLYAYVIENGITRDKTTLLTNWRFMLRQYQNELDELNETIIETENLLKGYKNDEVFITMQESDAAKSTKSSTAYYNKLILQQIDNYDKAATLKTNIADYTDRINRLESKTRTEVTDMVTSELMEAISKVQASYEHVRSQTEEVFESPIYTTFEDFSSAQGREQNFISASAKNMVIGGVLGIVVACGLWFLAALAPEFFKEGKVKNARKENEQ